MSALIMHIRKVLAFLAAAGNRDLIAFDRNRILRQQSYSKSKHGDN
jgi:hypothetical protein